MTITQAIDDEIYARHVRIIDVIEEQSSRAYYRLSGNDVAVASVAFEYAKRGDRKAMRAEATRASTRIDPRDRFGSSAERDVLEYTDRILLHDALDWAKRTKVDSGALRNACNVATWASSPRVQENIRIAMDRYVVLAATEAARAGKFRNAVIYSEYASTRIKPDGPPTFSVEQDIREAIDPYICERARGLAKRGNVNDARDILDYASSPEARQRMVDAINNDVAYEPVPRTRQAAERTHAKMVSLDAADPDGRYGVLVASAPVQGGLRKLLANTFPRELILAVDNAVLERELQTGKTNPQLETEDVTRIAEEVCGVAIDQSAASLLADAMHEVRAAVAASPELGGLAK